MEIHVGFPSIEQFRTTVKTVRDRASYHNVPLPKLKFRGTVKLHGTNAGVVRNPVTRETWAQSREHIITVEKDNAGFAKFVDENTTEFDRLLNIAAGTYGFHKILPGQLVAIYGEWCGGSIQKSVALNKLPKMFVLFGARIVITDETVDDAIDDANNNDRSVWFTPDQLAEVMTTFKRETGESSIYSISEFPTWDHEIDFANPAVSQNHLGELTTEVERECPAGKHFGVSGVGEGVVWRCIDDWVVGDQVINTSGLVFKVKGEKHSDTKVKTLAPVDVEKVNSINEFASNVVTDHRLDKMVEKMVIEGIAVEAQSIPRFLSLVGEDVIKEESDTMEASGLERKDVMKAVNNLARQWFLAKVNQV